MFVLVLAVVCLLAGAVLWPEVDGVLDRLRDRRETHD